MEGHMESEATPTEATSPPPSQSAAADPFGPMTDVVQSVRRELVNQAETRPYITVFAALAAGYVLGGGVPTWATRAAFNLGSRLLVARLVSAVVDDR